MSDWAVELAESLLDLLQEARHFTGSVIVVLFFCLNNSRLVGSASFIAPVKAALNN